MRVLGIDLGKKRVGLAVSDEQAEIAFPAGTLASRGKRRDIQALCALIKEREIGRVVVGLPLHMDGRRGPEAEKAQQFAKDLAKAAGIPVDLLDERWTSLEAERLMRGTSKKKRASKRNQGTVDEMAASIILRTYLAQRAANEAATDNAADNTADNTADNATDNAAKSDDDAEIPSEPPTE